MSTFEKVESLSFRTIGKSDFPESDHFHGFAFSDRGEDIFDLRKNYSFGKPIPKKYFPEIIGNYRKTPPDSRLFHKDSPVGS